jgi:hypothetical protein
MATLTGSGVYFSDGTTINGTETNSIGSYAFLAPNDSAQTTYGIGAIKAGSQLNPVGVEAIGALTFNSYRPLYSYTQGVTMTGTWRIQGSMTVFFDGDTYFAGASLWVRIT